MDNQSTDGNHEPRSSAVDLFRLGATYRWQVVHTAKQQSVAEHSHQVAILVLQFCTILNWDPKNYLVYAILHDAEEAWIGDIATPAKRMMDQRNLPLEKMLGNLYVEYNAHLDVKLFVKLADDVEAIKFLNVYGANRHGDQVRNRIAAHGDEIFTELKTKFPDASWDLVEEFIFEYINGEGETYADDYI